MALRPTATLAQTAFASSAAELQAVYLLSDGMPNGGHSAAQIVPHPAPGLAGERGGGGAWLTCYPPLAERERLLSCCHPPGVRRAEVVEGREGARPVDQQRCSQRSLCTALAIPHSAQFYSIYTGRRQRGFDAL